MNKSTDSENIEINKEGDNILDESPDPYFQSGSFRDLPDEEKSDAFLILAFFIFPVGVYLFFKYKKKKLDTARKFIFVSVFGLVMLLFIRFLIVFLNI